MTDTDPLTEIRRHIAYSIDMDPTGHEERIQSAPNRQAATFTIAQEIIDAYTHSLAEHIRDNLDGDGGFPDGMRHAADLIDPETP